MSQQHEPIDTRERPKQSFQGGLGLVVPILWSAHTLAGVLLVGVERTSFGQHKIEQGFSPTASWKVLIVTHAILACAALVAGAIATREATFKKRFGAAHRFSGRIYALCVLGSGLLSAPLLPHASGGLPGQVGLGVLLASWLLATGWAVQAIRKGRVAEHRRWTARSYALTFANLALHLMQALLMAALQMDREIAYRSAALICTPLCLAAGEIVIWRRRRAPPEYPRDSNSWSEVA